MTNYVHGHHAEKVAARYLRQQGYKVYALNWRHPRAEIDIVAQQPGEPVVFVEVKYRTTTAQGGGLEYVTPRKLSQMQFAAEIWIAHHHYDGEYTLGALEVSGPDYVVTDFLPELI